MEYAEPRLGGNGYPAWFRRRVLISFFSGTGSIGKRATDAASRWGVDVRSLRRWRALLSATGRSLRKPHTGGPKKLLTQQDDILLILYTCKCMPCLTCTGCGGCRLLASFVHVTLAQILSLGIVLRR